MSVKKVLIAGCGDVGSRLSLRLSCDGCQVWGLRRDISRLPSGLQAIQADLSDDRHFPDLPTALDAVVYCAAAGQRDEDSYRRTYVSGLQTLLSQLKKQHIAPKRILFTSSTAVYGQDAGEWVNEASVTQPNNFNGKLLLEAEQLLANSGFEHVILRFGGIYGPGRGALLRQLQAGKVQVCEDFPQYTNRIHSEDCAGFLQHLLGRDRVASHYVVVDNESAPMAEVADWLARRMAIDLPKRVPRERIEKGQNKRCDNSRLRETGYRLLYPSYREGYQALLNDLHVQRAD